MSVVHMETISCFTYSAHTSNGLIFPYEGCTSSYRAWLTPPRRAFDGGTVRTLFFFRNQCAVHLKWSTTMSIARDWLYVYLLAWESTRCLAGIVLLIHGHGPEKGVICLRAYPGVGAIMRGIFLYDSHDRIWWWTDEELWSTCRRWARADPDKV